MKDLDAAITAIRSALSMYTFRARSEADLQIQVVATLGQRLPQAHIDTEVREGRNRFDVALRFAREEGPPGRKSGLIVLELKTTSSVAAVERQALRYAQVDDVDAVGVVTTSARLAAGLGRWPSLGGKPLFVVALRSS